MCISQSKVTHGGEQGLADHGAKASPCVISPWACKFQPLYITAALIRGNQETRLVKEGASIHIIARPERETSFPSHCSL